MVIFAFAAFAEFIIAQQAKGAAPGAGAIAHSNASG
jgi:hypothetical protein